MATIPSEIEKKYDIYVKEQTGKLIQDLNSARKERRLCDCLIKVGSEEIPAHRIILSEGCDYYRGMFTHEMRESQSGIVEMKGVDPECMVICIEYIYTGKISVRESKIHPLLQIAQMLQLTGLFNALVAFLVQHLDAESFFVTRDLANNFGLTELQKICEQYGKENFEAISQQEGFQHIDKKSIISLVTSEGNKAPENIKVKSIFRWIKSEPEARKKCLRELHKHVDFAKVPIEYRRKLIEDEPLVYSCSEVMQRICISVMDTANIQSCDVGAVGGTAVQQPNISVPLSRRRPICQKITVDKDILAYMQLVQAQDLQKICEVDFFETDRRFTVMGHHVNRQMLIPLLRLYLCKEFLEILERLIYARIEPVIDPQLPLGQASFRRGRSTVDQVTLLTHDLEDGFEAKKKVGAIFIMEEVLNLDMAILSAYLR